MSQSLEARTLHFDFSSYRHEREFTLLAGGGRRVELHRYADHGSKLDEHIARNPALKLMAEHGRINLTHFVEEAQFTTAKPSLRRVVFPSLDDHPLPEIALVFPHIPRSHLIAAHRRFYRGGKRAPQHYALGHYGVHAQMFLEHAAGLSEADLFALTAGAEAVQPPGVTAQSIALNHPELGSVNPGVMTYVKDNYLNPLSSQDMSDFVQYIQSTQPGEGAFCWYNKSWVQWSQNDDGTGPMVPAEVNTDLVYKNGEKKTDWPVPPGQTYQGMPAYNLTDQYDPPAGNAANESVIAAASPVVQSTLLATKTVPDLNGLLWTSQNGVTQTTPAGSSSAPVPTPPVTPGLAAGGTTPAAAILADVGASAQGFAVKNLTSSYGLYLYDLAFDTGAKTVTLPVKNWPSRYLGAYVQFQQQDGTPIKRSDIPNWTDKLPLELVRGFVEPSDSKNYLTWLSSGNAIFGAPVPPLTQITNLSFPWPDAASKAVVMMGGLGCASGFRDWDGDVDVVGVLGTAIVNYGVGTLTLLADVYIVNPFIDALEGDNAVAFYAVAGVIGASALVVGVGVRDTSWGKWILSTLAGVAAGVVFGQAASRLIKAGAIAYAKTIAEAAGETVAEMTAEEALEEVPVAGWALRVVSIASDIAALAATTVECLVSPATYQVEILRSMDLTVTVKPDPTHGKTGFNPVWPAVSEHYVIQVKYPSGNNQDGGTTYTLAGPMPGQHDAPIVVTFKGIPAGGKIEVVANIYSSTDWLAGTWNSGWIDAVPDSKDQLAASGAIVEMLVPLTGTTTYSQKQAIAYSTTSNHYWEVSQFSIDAKLTVDFDKGGTPDAAVQAVFADNGNPLSPAATISVVSAMNAWTLTDPANSTVFDVKARQIFIGPVFTLSPLSQYKDELNKGGAVPGDIATAFDNQQYPLPAGALVTTVTANSTWTIALPGQLPLFELDASGAIIQVSQTGYELTVQNSAQPKPPLPQQYPLSTAPTGHALGALQNIIINDQQFELGYAYLASGQNMPIDNQPGTSQLPMYAMQSISTLGQPQEQIIQPTKGFSLPTFLAYDQFGLTPLFTLPWSVEPGLQNGPVPADLARQFAAFGYPLPGGATIAVVTADKDWLIEAPGDSDPLFELRAITTQVKGKPVQQVGVFDYPVPGIDNFFLEPQPAVTGQPLSFNLRGVKLDTPPGEYTFDYSAPGNTDVWGVFQNATPFQEIAVHPNGYVVGLDNTNAKMFVLKLPANAMAPDVAPLAMPLAGKGGREGLLDSPQAMTVTADGRILVLETGTLYIDRPRIQAFDVKGNPVPSFAVGQPSFQIPNGASFIAQLDALEVSLQLLELFQQNITPALAPKAILDTSLQSVAADLDQGQVDDTLLATFQHYGLAGQDATTAQFTVTTTKAGALWFVTDTKSNAVYDVRLVSDPATGFDLIDVYMQFGLSVTLKSSGVDWKIEDSVNAMTFEVTKAATGDTLTVQQLCSYMPLRSQSVTGTLSYLDIATETKGYVYVLGVIDNNYDSSHDPRDLVFQLDIYNPDGTPLLDQPQPGINAGKITVDQYRSLFSLNFNVVIGPNSRTEPGVSQWIPSTPTPAS